MYEFQNFIQNNDLDKHVIGLYMSNPQLTISEIARQTNKSTGEIYRILHAHEIQPNRLKIHHQKVESLAKLGWGIKDISGLTGYSTRNVRYILKGKPWQQ